MLDILMFKGIVTQDLIDLKVLWLHGHYTGLEVYRIADGLLSLTFNFLFILISPQQNIAKHDWCCMQTANSGHKKTIKRVTDNILHFVSCIKLADNSMQHYTLLFSWIFQTCLRQANIFLHSTKI
jgi:hypothetical protein